MIEKMKSVTVVAPIKRRKELLLALREAGVLHVSGLVQRSKATEEIDKDILSLTKVVSVVKEAADKKKEYKQVSLKGDDFKAKHEELVSSIEKKDELLESVRKLNMEIQGIEPWGDFNPDEVLSLRGEGVELHFYTMGKKEVETLLSNENVNFIRLKDVNKMSAVAVIGSPLERGTIAATELELPEISLAQMRVKVEKALSEVSLIEKKLEEANAYLSSYADRIKQLEEDEMFLKVDATAWDEDETITLLQGYVPVDKTDIFKAAAKENGWAYLIDDPTEDENPPTLLKYKGLIRIIAPIYKVLGTVPGYREYDISLYFLLYFAVFFAMIIGDAGYGLIFLLAGVIMHIKSKKLSDMNILLYVMAVATIVWGTITGTWFGSLAILEKLPFLQKLIIPGICNYSQELFGISSSFSQNAVMKLCFILGASQLALACIINVVAKIRKKDLSFVADIGWFIDVVVLYMLTLYLVIGESINFTPVIYGVACGFILVVLFGGQAPGVPFVKGLFAGLGDFFTVFLNTISCFSNIMSYIRLFAVGMASLAIAQSFNSMAAGMTGAALPAGILVVVIGHALNLVMGLLSVVVHGVRLNLLEFSGQLGMEWSGYNYDPFKKTVIDNAN